MRTSTSTPDHNQDGKHGDDIEKFQYTFQLRCPQDTRFIPPPNTNPPYVIGTGPGSAFCAILGSNVVEDGHLLNVILSVWGQSFNLVYGAAVEDLRDVAQHGEVPAAEMLFDQNIAFEVPSTTARWEIIGTTITGKPISLVNDASSDELRFINATTVGDKKIVTYHVQLPKL
jgi:hypothetical protein